MRASHQSVAARSAQRLRAPCGDLALRLLAEAELARVRRAQRHHPSAEPLHLHFASRRVVLRLEAIDGGQHLKLCSNGNGLRSLPPVMGVPRTPMQVGPSWDPRGALVGPSWGLG